MPHLGPRTEARGLIASQAIFNIGFYAIIPFLVVALRDDYGQSAAAIGVILGARTFAQQGLFVVGGLLADRFGARAMIFLGCWMRALGFLLILVAQGFWLLLCGAVIIGVAGAMFSPALESRLSRAEPSGRVSAFVWLMTIGEIGAALGPVLGLWLMGRGFNTSLAMGIVLFATMGVVFALVLPTRHVQRGVGLLDLRAAIHPTCLLFCLLASGNLLAYNQLYFLYPMVLGAGRGSAMALLFGVVSGLTIVTQIPIHRWLADRRGALGIRLGFIAVSCGFLVVGVFGDGLVPIVGSVVLLGLGHLVLTPAHQNQVLLLMRDERLRGAHLGLLATFGGVAVITGNTVIGQLADRFGADSPIIWCGLGMLLLVPAVALPAVLARESH